MSVSFFLDSEMIHGSLVPSSVNVFSGSAPIAGITTMLDHN